MASHDVDDRLHRGASRWGRSRSRPADEGTGTTLSGWCVDGQRKETAMQRRGFELFYRMDNDLRRTIVKL
jgi:hypothetical protein